MVIYYNKAIQKHVVVVDNISLTFKLVSAHNSSIDIEDSHNRDIRIFHLEKLILVN